MNNLLAFPTDFRWGAATAAHQNEGGNRANQWAAWEQQPGRIYQGQVSGQAGAMQVEGATRFATLNIGGSCATVVSFVVGVDG